MPPGGPPDHRTPVLTIGLSIALLFASILPAQSSSQLEQEILQEMNVARTDPSSLVPPLEKRLTRFEGNLYRPPGSTTFIITREGPQAVEEAIAFLENQRPLSPLVWNDELVGAAAELARSQAQSGLTGHGEGKMGMKERIERHLEWAGSIAENISYGPDEAREVVLQMIVDDGAPDRGHRTTLFSPRFRLAGVDCGSHPTFRTVCVIDFAAGAKN